MFEHVYRDRDAMESARERAFGCDYLAVPRWSDRPAPADWRHWGKLRAIVRLVTEVKN